MILINHGLFSFGDTISVIVINLVNIAEKFLKRKLN